MQVDQNDEDQPHRREFGVHPRRVRVNPIIDRCENELVDSGILGSRSWVEEIPLIRYLGRIAPHLMRDQKLRENILLAIVILSLIICLIIIYPLLQDLGASLGGIMDGKPLVPDIIS
jgi:hypothetical protein